MRLCASSKASWRNDAEETSKLLPVLLQYVLSSGVCGKVQDDADEEEAGAEVEAVATVAKDIARCWQRLERREEPAELSDGGKVTIDGRLLEIPG